MLKTLLAAADPEKYGNRPRATAEQLEVIRRSMEDAKGEADDARKMEAIERIMRKLWALNRRKVREGYGLTVTGEMVPPGYGPVSPDAVPIVAEPEKLLWPQVWEQFLSGGELGGAAE
jgi:hypothetical protein